MLRASNVICVHQFVEMPSKKFAADGHVQLIKRILEHVVSIQLVNLLQHNVQRWLELPRGCRQYELESGKRLEALQLESLRLELLDALGSFWCDLLNDSVQ